MLLPGSNERLQSHWPGRSSRPACESFEEGAPVVSKLEGISEQAKRLFARREIDAAFQLADGTYAQSSALGQGFPG